VLEIDPRHKEAKARFVAINNSNQGMASTSRLINSCSLQMIHPAFNVPNTLLILKKYKNNDDESPPNSPRLVQEQSNFDKIN
jgi:hypothetical protein